MRQLTLEITAKEREVLDYASRRHPKPYVRERSQALIWVSEGHQIKTVAKMLMKKRQARSVSNWVKAYQSDGFDGLIKRAGSGRKPSFSPPQ